MTDTTDTPEAVEANADMNADMNADVNTNANTEANAPVQPGANPGARKRRKPGNAGGAARGPAAQPARVNPVLEKLAALYPALFGEVFLPLKRGIFEELLAAHPEDFEREALKEALSQHTRSTRYLTGVAAGRARHDLQAQVVEDMAPEHVHHALLEVFRRRARRGNEDLRPQLRERMVLAFEASGLSALDYSEKVRSRDEEANDLLDQALAEAATRAAKGEALLRAFEASGQTVDVFADMYGLEPKAAERTLDRARKARA